MAGAIISRDLYLARRASLFLDMNPKNILEYIWLLAFHKLSKIAVSPIRILKDRTRVLKGTLKVGGNLPLKYCISGV